MSIAFLSFPFVAFDLRHLEHTIASFSTCSGAAVGGRPHGDWLATFATVTSRDGEARRMVMLLTVPLDAIQGEAA